MLAEIVIEANGGIGIPADNGGQPYTWEGLRVRYRRLGDRVWQRFSIVGDERQSLADLIFGAIDTVGPLPRSAGTGSLMAADRNWLAAHGRLIELHVEKSSTYGTGDDRFANFTAVADATGMPPERYVLERILEKVTRALNMIDAGRHDEVVEYPDIASLGLCCQALQARRLEPLPEVESPASVQPLHERSVA